MADRTVKGWVGDTPYANEVPTPEQGNAWALTEKEPDQPGFVQDEKTGLFCPLRKQVAARQDRVSS